MIKNVLLALIILAICLLGYLFLYKERTTKHFDEVLLTKKATDNTYSQNINQNEQEDIPERIITKSEDITDSYINKALNINYDEYTKKLETVLSGKTPFHQKINEWDLELDQYTYGSPGNWVMHVYKYDKNNTKIKWGYEGPSKYIWDLDKEVSQYKGLHIGDQNGYYYLSIGSPTEVNINQREIGKKKYAIYDTIFAPAASITRHYFLYDSENEQLIYMEFSISTPPDSTYTYIDTPNSNVKKVKYTDKFDTFFHNFENNVLAKN